MYTRDKLAIAQRVRTSYNGRLPVLYNILL